ncbi:hypothetical protein Acsp02_73200 [Actinoplanes sp. NBRC 103695]|nr:hypothetical protein Acsp02_73200 [Actinoplanes sp. NBRC 103695]
MVGPGTQWWVSTASGPEYRAQLPPSAKVVAQCGKPVADGAWSYHRSREWLSWTVLADHPDRDTWATTRLPPPACPPTNSRAAHHRERRHQP